ncbi:hypothetical protein [Nocardia brevicatena]|uniref:hypothetical protein n=1 Tax=Nocardia brevicatena TaxID=37327 RepID=UPI00030ABEBC|nr:hypothetical protein [Nocardia brevicatena]
MNRDDEHSEQDRNLPTEPLEFAQGRELLDLHKGRNCQHLHDAFASTVAVL